MDGILGGGSPLPTVQSGDLGVATPDAIQPASSAPIESAGTTPVVSSTAASVAGGATAEGNVALAMAQAAAIQAQQENLSLQQMWTDFKGGQKDETKRVEAEREQNFRQTDSKNTQERSQFQKATAEKSQDAVNLKNLEEGGEHSQQNASPTQNDVAEGLSGSVQKQGLSPGRAKTQYLPRGLNARFPGASGSNAPASFKTSLNLVQKLVSQGPKNTGEKIAFGQLPADGKVLSKANPSAEKKAANGGSATRGNSPENAEPAPEQKVIQGQRFGSNPGLQRAAVRGAGGKGPGSASASSAADVASDGAGLAEEIPETLSDEQFAAAAENGFVPPAKKKINNPLEQNRIGKVVGIGDEEEGSKNSNVADAMTGVEGHTESDENWFVDSVSGRSTFGSAGIANDAEQISRVVESQDRKLKNMVSSIPKTADPNNPEAAQLFTQYQQDLSTVNRSRELAKTSAPMAEKSGAPDLNANFEKLGDVVGNKFAEAIRALAEIQTKQHEELLAAVSREKPYDPVSKRPVSQSRSAALYAQNYARVAPNYEQFQNIAAGDMASRQGQVLDSDAAITAALEKKPTTVKNEVNPEKNPEWYEATRLA